MSTDLDIASSHSASREGSDTRHMRRAALYARVSTERQKEEATIESQVFELKKQIALSGNVLVKEYIEDGHTGRRASVRFLTPLSSSCRSCRINRSNIVSREGKNALALEPQFVEIICRSAFQ